jgi:hypothetical protein
VKYQSLDVPNASSTSIQGVNNSGTLVGGFGDKNSVGHGFIFANGQVTTVDGPNAVENTTGGGPNGTELTAISNNGLIVGDQRVIIAGAAGTYAQAFLFQNGKFTIFTNVQASNAIPTGVNSAGVTVGVGDLVGCCNVSWIRNPDGSISNFFEASGMNPALPEGINDSGKIVGDGPFIFEPNFTPPPYPNPTTAANGTFAQFTVPGTSDPAPQGINNSEQVVGSYTVPNSSPLFFGWMKTGSNYCSLSVPGAKLTQATDVNDSGLIVGSYQDATGVQHGFIAK